MKPTPDEEWITRDGRRMRVTEMTEGHLANAIALFERRLATFAKAEPFSACKVTIGGVVWHDTLTPYEGWQARLDKLRREDARRGSGPMRALADYRIAVGLAA